MPQILYKGKTFFAEKGQVLVHALIQNGDATDHPCGGKGICKRCTVKVNGKPQLSCKYIVETDIVVEDMGEKEVFSFIGAEETGEVTENMCFCLDIGTTTMALALVSLDNKSVVKTVAATNPQRIFSADVISRIEYSVNNSFCEMHLKLLEQINRIIAELSEEDVKTVVTGNTVMLSIYLGVEIESMGKYPYTPKELFGKEMTVSDKKVYLPRCISAFIGADIYCGLIASGIYNKERAVLIDIGTNGEIVLKNKEKFICTSAAAGPAFEGAGLSCGMGAYEGAVSKVYAQGTNLRYKTIGKAKPTGICGSGIIDFISQLKIYNVLSEEGIINKEGHPFTHLIYEVDGEKRIYLSDCDIYITQKDIYNILLAKSAILSSLETVIEEEQLDYNHIECVYLSGGFANYMDIESAVKIGLIPFELKEKIEIIGNGAGMGALILSQNLKVKIKDAEFNVIELNNSSHFNEKFIKNLNIKKV